MKAALSAQINKSDRNDARGIAQMMRVGLYRPVHVKTLASQKRRMLLTSRQLLQAKALDIENDLRGMLRNFGLKVGMVGTVEFEARIRELVADHPDLAAIVEPLLIARRVLREQLGVLHRQLLEIVRQDEVCRRLMTTPGVGPVVALTFRATVDVPSRFNNSKAVGAALGLTPRRQQSGEIDRMGGISKCGDAMMREMLFEAALVLMTHSRKWSWLKAWGMKIARHRGIKRAIVAVARRLAVIMHRMWVDGTRVSLEQKRSCGGMTGSVRWWVRIAAARMFARCARSPSSPAPAARRCAALGLDRSARPSKQATVPSMHTCDAHHVVSQLCTITIGEN